MNNEPNSTIIKEELIPCDRCGSVDFCITQEFHHSFIWVKCRQCDKTFGLVHKIKGDS